MGSLGIIAGSVFILIGAVLIFIFVWERIRTRDISKWPHVRGKVIRSEVVQRFSDGNAFDVVVGYRYYVNGVELEGVGISLDGNDTERSESAAQRKASRFPVERAVEVFYNPSSPQESCLLVRSVTFNVAFIVGGAILAGAGFFLVMVPPTALLPATPSGTPTEVITSAPPTSAPAKAAETPAAEFRVTSVRVKARVISGEIPDSSVQAVLDPTTLALRACLNRSESGASVAGDWVYSLEVRPNAQRSGVQRLSAPAEDDRVNACLSNVLSEEGLPRSDEAYQVWATVTVE